MLVFEQYTRTYELLTFFRRVAYFFMLVVYRLQINIYQVANSIA